MIVNEIIDPKTIAVVGGSRNTSKPGGKILKNLAFDRAQAGSTGPHKKQFLCYRYAIPVSPLRPDKIKREDTNLLNSLVQ